MKSNIKKIKRAYAKLHTDTIIETYGSRKFFKNSLKERMKLNRLL